MWECLKAFRPYRLVITLFFPGVLSLCERLGLGDVVLRGGVWSGVPVGKVSNEIVGELVKFYKKELDAMYKFHVFLSSYVSGLDVDAKSLWNKAVRTNKKLEKLKKSRNTTEHNFYKEEFFTVGFCGNDVQSGVGNVGNVGNARMASLLPPPGFPLLSGSDLALQSALNDLYLENRELCTQLQETRKTVEGYKQRLQRTVRMQTYYRQQRDKQRNSASRSEGTYISFAIVLYIKLKIAFTKNMYMYMFNICY